MMKASILSASAVLASCFGAQAYILIGSGAGMGGDGNLSGPVGGGPGAWTYSYYLELENASIAGGTLPASGFVIWDYPGVTAASIAPAAGAGWTVSIGAAPAPLDPGIPDTGAPDVIAEYTGPLIADPVAPGQTPLGVLTVTSIFGPIVTTPAPNYQSRVNVKLPQGNVQVNTLTTVVPVPEASSVAAGAGLALLGLGCVLRRKLKA